MVDRRMRRAPALLMVVMVVAACTTTTTGSPSTTAAPRFRVEGPSLFPPEPLPGSDGASGSGCPNNLPADGVWFAYVEEVAPAAVGVVSGCLYFGDIAWEKAAEVGEEAPNDVWIVRGDQPITVPVAAGARAYTIVTPPDSELTIEPVAFGEWPDPLGYTPCPGEFCTVWLYINGGEVTEILEQYLP
jgi:hypothetical protein